MKTKIILLLTLVSTSVLFAGVADFDKNHKISLSFDYSKQDRKFYVTLANNGDKAVVFTDGLFDRIKYETTALNMRTYCVYADGTTEGNNVRTLPEYDEGYSDKIQPSILVMLDDVAQVLQPKQAISRSFSSKAVLKAFNRRFVPKTKPRVKYVVKVYTGLYSTEKDVLDTYIYFGSLVCILEIPADEFESVLKSESEPSKPTIANIISTNE
ncbi:hypothetical protein M2447_000680 [Ereboglobus sp. PH5-10]|uniref:hypothetical protein n=1 Tax=Ereboglobus sp. PH5-10 TaxID=2940629 RepID=UPI002406B177|nr:hypothetical protein [Ereboglobus sp. PH5-10]MDF9826599.1 hypothetical protein [Ereboglobus sp. PH5-10]